jgi:uncharacterized membrane protein (DUF2068 family)
VDWSLLTCGVRGHVSYAPEEPGLRARLHATSAAGEAWRCLRCGTFVPGAAGGGGAAAAAPDVRRGKELRSALILRLFAVERLARAILFAFISYAVWRFKYSRNSIEQAFDRELPVVRTLLNGLGYNVDHSKLIGLIQQAFTLDSHTLTWLAIGTAVYALVELVEGTGLWLLQRWGEYFAMVATSAGIPYEIYDLTAKITVLRLAFFAVNVALVVYLVLTKRLFGARGGKEAYDARLRGASIVDTELDAMAAQELAAQELAAQELAAQELAAQELAAQEQSGGSAALDVDEAAAGTARTSGSRDPVTPAPVTPAPVTPGRSGPGPQR